MLALSDDEVETGGLEDLLPDLVVEVGVLVETLSDAVLPLPDALALVVVPSTTLLEDAGAQPCGDEIRVNVGSEGVAVLVEVELVRALGPIVTAGLALHELPVDLLADDEV